MISLLLFFLAGACRGVAELVGYEHGDSIFSAKVPQHSFWGSQMWKRKYRTTKFWTLFADPHKSTKISKLRRWYYKAFRIKYEERFLFSTTVLVWLTDGMHLMNFLMKFFLIGACLAAPWIFLWTDIPLMIVMYAIAWSAGFNVTYSFLFSKKIT